MTTELQNRIGALINSDNGEFAKQLEAAQSKDEIIEAFAAHGIELTTNDADDLLKETFVDDELNEEALEDVAGGMSVWQAAKIGWGIGARVGMIGRMIYDKYKSGNPYKNYTWDNVLTGKLF